MTPTNLTLAFCPGFTGHLDTPAGPVVVQPLTHAHADPVAAQDAAHSFAAGYVDEHHPWDGQVPESADRAAAYNAACAAYLAAALPPAVASSAIGGLGDPAVEDMLRAYERYNRHTRPLCRGMYENRWELYAPASRSEGDEATAEYLRGVYGGKRRRVTAYINSRSLTVSTTAARQFALALTGAEDRVSGVVFRYGNADDVYRLLTQVIPQLVAWADGDADGEAEG